jgi:hypothetical protein
MALQRGNLWLVNQGLKLIVTGVALLTFAARSPMNIICCCVGGCGPCGRDACPCTCKLEPSRAPQKMHFRAQYLTPFQISAAMSISRWQCGQIIPSRMPLKGFWMQVFWAHPSRPFLGFHFLVVAGPRFYFVGHPSAAKAEDLFCCLVARLEVVPFPVRAFPGFAVVSANFPASRRTRETGHPFGVVTPTVSLPLHSVPAPGTSGLRRPWRTSVPRYLCPLLRRSRRASAYVSCNSA